jgi:hypothetical protein
MFGLWLTPLTRALIGMRDRALILVGFAGAFCRSELVCLTADDCAFGKDGLTRTLRRSNGSGWRGPEGRHPVQIEPGNVPRSESARWIEQAGISGGLLFRASIVMGGSSHQACPVSTWLAS